MRGRTPDVEDYAFDLTPLQAHHLRRQQVMGNDDGIGSERVQGLDLGAGQAHQHLTLDIRYIIHSFAQVFVLDIAEGRFDGCQRL